MSSTYVPAPGSTPQVGVHHKINTIYDFSDQALGELKLWLEAAGLSISVAQVRGFSQFTAQVAATVPATETRTSSAYGDLATAGPSLTGLPDGSYLFFLGCVAAGDPGVSNAHMSIQVNAAVATDADSCFTSVGSSTSISTQVKKDLSNDGDNTVTAKYRSSNNVFACSFASRYLIALRVANV